LFLGEDFLFWLEHYVDHHCRLFWAVHVTHHSSVEYNLTTGFRSSVLMPFYRYLYFVPLALAGFKPIDILFMYAVTQIYGILVHTRYIRKLHAWIEFIFVTPSHHRVHHASNTAYLDRNMGMALIIWDRMFGTFAEETDENPPVYGLTTNVDTPYHPVNIITHEWKILADDLKRAPSLKTKAKYLFMPPGWSHDGSTKTARQMQDELKGN
jgi:sterol desaturase/sphingolipid hydroxylase (fatty acid hydroxylase superfamily)